MNPKFSIIIPVYNLENYIRQCLDSVLSQSFQSWESIVVNDGSVDNSLQIITEYATKDNRYQIIDKPNAGLSAARNDALNVSKGDYIVFLDGDDWLESNALELINDFIGNTDLDLLVHQMKYYYTEENVKISKTIVPEGIYTGIDFIHTLLKNKQYNFYVAPAKAYRREFLEMNKLRFIQGIVHEDGPFFYEVCHKAKKVYFTKEALYFYRQNREGQITAKRNFRNYQGIVIGITNALNMYGRNDKIINGALLNLYTFLAGKYQSKGERNKAFKELRKWDTKKILIHLLMNSKISFNQWARSVILIIDPLLLNWVYKIWF